MPRQHPKKKQTPGRRSWWRELQSRTVDIAVAVIAAGFTWGLDRLADLL